jgi:hypothetical protein
MELHKKTLTDSKTNHIYLIRYVPIKFADYTKDFANSLEQGRMLPCSTKHTYFA